MPIFEPAGSGGAPLDSPYVVLTSDGVLTDERVLTGTANQVVLTDNGAGGTVVLSLPQSLHTAATPTFASVTLSGLTAGRVPYVSTAGLLADSAKVLWDNTAEKLSLVGTGAGSVIFSIANDGANPTGVAFVNTSATGTQTNSFFGSRYRNSVADPRRTQSADVLFRVGASGAYAADDLSVATVIGGFRANVAMHAAEAFTSTAQGAVMALSTTPIGSATQVESARLTDRGNLTIGANPGQPSTGTQAVIFADGTAPSSLATNTAGVYADDVSGTVQMFAIDEAGATTRLTWGTPQTYVESNVTTDRTYDANATSLDELADVLGTLIGDLRARGVVN